MANSRQATRKLSLKRQKKSPKGRKTYIERA